MIPVRADNRWRFTARSQTARRVFLSVQRDGAIEQVELERDSAGLFSAQLLRLGHGSRYAFHVDRPDAPRLVDPFALAVDGDWSVLVESLTPSAASSRPRIAWSETVIYEAHVRGLTRLHPDIPPEQAGTYAALRHPALIEHLHWLGISTLELLPIFHFVDAPHLLARGLTNYWGYAPVAWHAPSARYRACREVADTVDELKHSIAALHAAGIEVVLDVVFNHSGEDSTGIVSLRGLDEPNYFSHGDDGSPYDVTGCGNTLDAASPAVHELVLSSLVHCATEWGVDGFRFDLATTLGRTPHAFDSHAPLLQAIANHPALRDLKLIAEPWDIGPGGYRVGQFPRPFVEWNDQFRDQARRLARGDAGMVRTFTSQWMGAAHVFGTRAPESTLQFVTSHDGMTLRDLAAFAHKYNQANGEDNRDGVGNDWSDNLGLEGLDGETPELLDKRQRRMRALAGLLFTALGVPMWLAGDELGRTQQGNNNAYCHDNELSWLDWAPKWDPQWQPFAASIKRLIRLRRQLSQLGATTVPSPEEVLWLTSAGEPLTEPEWQQANAFAFSRHDLGSLLVACNPTAVQVHMHLPPGSWNLYFTSESDLVQSQRQVEPSFRAAPRSLHVFTREAFL